MNMIQPHRIIPNAAKDKATRHSKQKVREREGNRDRKLQGHSSERPLLQDKGTDFYERAKVPSETYFRHLNKTYQLCAKFRQSPAASKEQVLVEK